MCNVCKIIAEKIYHPNSSTHKHCCFHKILLPSNITLLENLTLKAFLYRLRVCEFVYAFVLSELRILPVFVFALRKERRMKGIVVVGFFLLFFPVLHYFSLDRYSVT